MRTIMKKNYKYLLLGIISISSLLLISIIPLIVNNNDATKNLSLRNDQLEKEKKTNPKMNKKKSMIQKTNPKMNRLKSKDWYKQNRKTANLSHHKVGLSKIYDLTGMKIKYDNNKNINITYIRPNSSAKNSGIQLNDKIISINSITLNGLKSIDIAQLIYESENKTVNILIERKGENITISLKV